MKLFKLIPLIAMAIAPLAYASPDSAGFVPAAWTTLPEEGAHLSALADFPAGDAKLDAAVDRILGVQRDALTNAAMPLANAIPPANMPADWVPWRFAAFASDLSVSASGLVGLLTFKGTPAVTVIWQKKEGKHNALVAEELPNEAAFAFRGAPTARDAETQTDAIFKTVLATGRVKNADGLRERIAESVTEFRRMALAANAAPAGGEWYASKLRVDIEVSASGKVSWGTVGGDVKLRLEWFRIQPSGQPATAAAAPVPGPLHDLISAMCEDLASASSTEPAAHFRASQFYVGLGLGASGTVGVASGSASAIGYLYFNRVAKPKAMPAAGFTNASWHLVQSHPSVEQLDFARRAGVETLAASPLAGDEPVLFRIDRAQFRAGLKRAMAIGSYFGNRATQSEGASWAVADVKPSFTLSVTGALGLAKMTGSAAAMIDFQNQNF
jgi:hypothetical protein